LCGAVWCGGGDTNSMPYERAKITRVKHANPENGTTPGYTRVVLGGSYFALQCNYFGLRELYRLAGRQSGRLGRGTEAAKARKTT